jgi:hypothetical protein
MPHSGMLLYLWSSTASNLNLSGFNSACHGSHWQFPPNDQIASDLSITFGKAMEFTMSNGLLYTLESAVLSLFLDIFGAQSACCSGLFADSNGDPDISQQPWGLESS